jgi:hypothetical protein
MTSSQLNFFLTRNDQAELLRKLDPLGKFVYVESISQNGSLRILERAEITKMGSERLKIFITLPKYLNNIILVQLPASAFVDVLRSPVIEFSRCYQDGKCMRRGRFYFIRRHFDESTEITKDEEFLKWSNSLILKARRVLRRDPESFAYFGSEALQLKDMGFKMDMG